MDILNLILVLIVIIMLVVVYKNKREIEKSIIKKTGESQFSNVIGRKMNTVEVFNDKDSFNIKDITKGNILGILISSSCSHCMTHFENFINQSSSLLSTRNYYLFLHKDDLESQEYLSLFQQKFQTLYYKDDFIKKNGFEFFPVFFMLDQEGIVKIFTPHEQKFLWELKEHGIIPDVNGM